MRRNGRPYESHGITQEDIPRVMVWQFIGNFFKRGVDLIIFLSDFHGLLID